MARWGLARSQQSWWLAVRSREPRRGIRCASSWAAEPLSLVDAPRYRFIAGGIGITPIAAMIEAAQRAGKDWTLLYGGRAKASMAFADDIAERYLERVTLCPQDERGLLDLESLLRDPRGQHPGVLLWARGTAFGG